MKEIIIVIIMLFPRIFFASCTYQAGIENRYHGFSAINEYVETKTKDGYWQLYNGSDKKSQECIKYKILQSKDFDKKIIIFDHGSYPYTKNTTELFGKFFKMLKEKQFINRVKVYTVPRCSSYADQIDKVFFESFHFDFLNITPSISEFTENRKKYLLVQKEQLFELNLPLMYPIKKIILTFDMYKDIFTFLESSENNYKIILNNNPEIYISFCFDKVKNVFYISWLQSKIPGDGTKLIGLAVAIAKKFFEEYNGPRFIAFINAAKVKGKREIDYYERKVGAKKISNFNNNYNFIYLACDFCDEVVDLEKICIVNMSNELDEKINKAILESNINIFLNLSNNIFLNFPFIHVFFHGGLKSLNEITHLLGNGFLKKKHYDFKNKKYQAARL